MKLAEALVRIKDIKGRINELTREASADSSFEQVEELSEVPSIEPVLEGLRLTIQTLSDLKVRIARTNVEHGLVEKIKEMEMLRSLISTLDPLARQKQKVVQLRRIDYEGPAQAMTTFATYNVATLTEELIVHRQRVRELDLELQRLNWQVELVD